MLSLESHQGLNVIFSQEITGINIYILSSFRNPTPGDTTNYAWYGVSKADIPVDISFFS